MTFPSSPNESQSNPMPEPAKPESPPEKPQPLGPRHDDDIGAPPTRGGDGGPNIDCAHHARWLTHRAFTRGGMASDRFPPAAPALTIQALRSG